MKKPLIGIVLDREPKGDYSMYPYYVLRGHYFAVIEKAGGIPVGVPLSSDLIDDYLELVDGILLPGGDYDIPPHMYGDKTVHESVVTKTERLEFDIEITEKCLKRDIPLFGICAGEQLLAVLTGGTLIQDIASEIPGSFEHYQDLRTSTAHTLNIVEGTKLHSIIGSSTLAVNSHHHQAVRTVGKGMIIAATTSDGVIEAIESTEHSFCIGVEWHPEFLISREEEKIFKAFIKACT